MIPDILLVTFFGLVLGSFASAVSWRVPRGLSWIASGGKAAQSACPACGNRLSWRDLVPLFSWIFLRGRCRHCGVAVGWRYPLIELATMAGCIAAYVVYGWSLPGGILMLAMPFLVAMIAIDLEHMILPDQINIILAVLGLAFAFATGAVPGALAGAAVYGGVALALGRVMCRVLKKDALGMGDVKFFAVAGLWLGLAAFPVFLILSGLCGVGLGLVFRIWKGEALFPFGPALVFALLVAVLFLAEIRAFQGLPSF